MGESQRSDVVIPDHPKSDEIGAQLEESRRLRAEAEVKVERAEQTASDMARVLRRIAAAMDRNPQSWDDLFLSRKERP